MTHVKILLRVGGQGPIGLYPSTNSHTQKSSETLDFSTLIYYGPMDSQMKGPMDRPTDGPLDRQTSGIMQWTEETSYRVACPKFRIF